jgi:ferrous iron transport protein B
MAGVGSPDLITYGMYLLGIIVAIISVILMRSTTLKGETPLFIMELPTYRLPQFKNLMLHLWDKAKHFIEKAFTIILASTIVIWFVSHFSFNWQFLTDEAIDQSILANVGQLVTPLFTPLGFGSQVNDGLGWVFVVSVITGLIAKENAIAVLCTLSACILKGLNIEGEEALISSLIAYTNVSIPALLAFIAFNMTTIPCFATVATTKGELSNKKTFNLTLLFWVVVSYLVASAIYLVGSYVWPIAIYLIALVLALVLIAIRNRRLEKKNLTRF